MTAANGAHFFLPSPRVPRASRVTSGVIQLNVCFYPCVANDDDEDADNDQADDQDPDEHDPDDGDQEDSENLEAQDQLRKERQIHHDDRTFDRSLKAADDNIQQHEQVQQN